MTIGQFDAGNLSVDIPSSWLSSSTGLDIFIYSIYNYEISIMYQVVSWCQRYIHHMNEVTRGLMSSGFSYSDSEEKT